MEIIHVSFVILNLLTVLYCVSLTSAQNSCSWPNTIEAKVYARTLSSPNYPSPYPSFTSCRWTIEAPYGYVVELVFQTFQTQKRNYYSQCTDYLLIYNGNVEMSSKLLGKYCGSYLPPKVYSSGTSLLLRFNSDSSLEYKGFKIEYKAKKPSPDSLNCSPFNSAYTNNAFRLSASSTIGYLKSPLYTANGTYPSNIQCTWIITAPYGYRVQLRFSSFKLPTYTNSYSCSTSHDYLEIRNGYYYYSSLSKRLCGTSQPSSVTSTGRNMWIRFKSNSDNYFPSSSAGFYATFVQYKHNSNSGGSTGGAGLVTGIVITGIIGVVIFVCCVCVAKRRRTAGHVNRVPAVAAAVTVQTTSTSTSQYPTAGPTGPPPSTGSFPPPVGYYPSPQGSYPPPQGSYPPPQGSYHPPPGAGYPTYPQGISNDPPPMYPGPPAYPPQAPAGQPPAYPPQAPAGQPPAYPPQAPVGQPSAAATPYPSFVGPSTHPNQPYPPPQGAENQQSPLPYPQDTKPSAPPF